MLSLVEHENKFFLKPRDLVHAPEQLYKASLSIFLKRIMSNIMEEHGGKVSTGCRTIINLLFPVTFMLMLSRSRSTKTELNI